ncbi:MAG: alanine racemase [Oscillospiraceae bacterium]|nr:alanine racemase [Oscillospiraceae bacterium]
MEFERRCWVEVNLDIIEQNYKAVSAAAGGLPVMAVVKADAYGHGDIEVAKTLNNLGACCFAVSGLYEGIRLRNAGITKPILILGYTNPSNAAELAAHNLIQTLVDTPHARALSAAAVAEGVTVDVHVGVDTGMGRIGFNAKHGVAACAAEIAAAIQLEGLAATGIFTHFAVADSADPDDIAYTKMQYNLLSDVIKELAAIGISFACCHCCNSAGIMAYDDMRIDMVRAGVILYGYNPSNDVPCPTIHPAMQLKTIITMVKDVLPGEYLSYGRKFCVSKPMRVATLAIGYADGYVRSLSGKGVVSVNGKGAPVLGTVCMDQCMIDVTDIDCKQGDIVTVYNGKNGDSIDDVAAKINSITYEIICDIGRRVQRVYVRNGKEVSMVNYMLD